MVIQCPECGKKYKIDPEKVPDKGAKISCPECGHAFVVKKKEKEPAPVAEETPKLKTPPCVACGNPSTRVLKGDPPMVLCEACFEREKEKRRRFEVLGTEAGASSEPAPAPEAPAKGQELTTEPAGPGGDDYFDSFDQVPKMDELPPEKLTTVSMSPQPAPTSKPEQQPAKPVDEKFVGHEEAVFDEKSFEVPAGSEPEIEVEKVRTPGPKPAEPAAEKIRPPAPSGPAMAEKPKAHAAAEPESSEEEYQFSPDEVGEGEAEDTAPAKPPAGRERPSAISSTYAYAPSSDKGKTREDLSAPAGASQLDKEIFGDIAAKTRAPSQEQAAAMRVKKPFKFPFKAVGAAVVAAAVLAGGYFAWTNPALRAKLAGLKDGANGKPAPAKVLTEQDQRAINEHLSMAQALYFLDTKKSYMDSLTEIRAALRIDHANKDANRMQILVSALMALHEQGWLLRTRAKTLLGKAGADAMSDPQVRAGRAALMLSQNNLSQAKMVLDRLLEDNPENALGNWLMGRTFSAYTIKDYERAEPFLKKAIELEPKLVGPRLDLAELYFAKKDYANAAAEFENVLKISPDRAEASEQLVAVHEAQKQSLVPASEPQKPQPGLLLAQQQGTTQAASTVSKPGPILLPATTATQPAPAAAVAAPPPLPEVEVDMDQEIQNHVFGVITETRKSLSRVRATTQAPAAPAPGPTGPPEAPPSAKPPEEAP